jgi:Sulfatase-modifying factor enzyme 1
MAARALFGWIAASLLSIAASAQTPAVGTAFRECSDCPEMVVLPAGSFTMGSPGHEAGRDEDEGPQRLVTIGQPFALGRYEITRGQFAAFVAASGYQSQGGNCWYWNGDESKFKNDDASLGWRIPGYSQNDGHPVVCVSWTDANAYADWLAKHTGKAFVAACSEPATFLGFELHADRRRRLPKDNVRRFRNRLRSLCDRWQAGTVTGMEVAQKVDAWVAHASHADTWQLRHAIFRGGWFDPANPRDTGA